MKRTKSQNYVSIATTAPSLLGNATNHNSSNWWKDIHALYYIAIIISYNSNGHPWYKRNKILLLLPRIKALLLSSTHMSTKENGLRVCYKLRVNLVYTSILCEFNMQRTMSMVYWMIIEAFNMDDVCVGGRLLCWDSITRPARRRRVIRAVRRGIYTSLLSTTAYCNGKCG